MSSYNLGFTFGIYNVEVGLSGSHESEFIKNITKNKSQVQPTDPKCFALRHVQFNISFLDEKIDTTLFVQ